MEAWLARVGGWIAEGGMAAVFGICAIGIGLVLIGIYRVTDPNAGYQATKRRPKKEYRATHKKDGEPGEDTRLLRPRNYRARAMVIDDARGQAELDKPGTPEGVREAQEEDGQEEGRSYRERWENESRALEDGAEGGTDKEAPRTLVGWVYNVPMDSYWLLDTTGEIVRVVTAEEWEIHRGRTAKDLLVQGFPMIPDEVPYHGREVNR